MQKGICPICGKENNCALVKGKPHSECWCNTTKVPKSLLDKVPEEQKKLSCICKECVLRETMKISE